MRGFACQMVGVCIAAILVAGCSSGPSVERLDSPPAEAPAPADPASQFINVGQGSGEQFGGRENRQRLWSVRWLSGRMEVFEEGSLAGTLSEVEGEIVREGHKDTRFSARQARSEKGQDVLWLSGDVTVVSQEPQATLRCDRLEYDADTETLKAMGDVRIESELGTMSVPHELWATPDLRLAGTPEMFKQQKR
jgi:hypothetical protein